MRRYQASHLVAAPAHRLEDERGWGCFFIGRTASLVPCSGAQTLGALCRIVHAGGKVGQCGGITGIRGMMMVIVVAAKVSEW